MTRQAATPIVSTTATTTDEGEMRSPLTKNRSAATALIVALALLAAPAAPGKTLDKPHSKTPLDPAIAASMAAHARALAEQRATGTPVNADPKNDWPFTRVVATADHGSAITAPLNAEPKNQWPFNRPIAGVTPPANPVLDADPKNEWPFTRHLDATPANVTAGNSGFSWTDSGIGLFAGIGIALLGSATLKLARKTRSLRPV